jgi:hypothetical protein
LRIKEREIRLPSSCLKQERSQANILINKHYLLAYLHAVEEWRRLTEINFPLKGRAEVKWCNLGDENMLWPMAWLHTDTGKVKLTACSKMGCRGSALSHCGTETREVFYAELFSEERQ